MIKRIWYWLTRYKLTNEEYVIWLKIKGKAKRGFMMWYKETKGNDLCGPWIPDLTEKETRILDKIYKHFTDEEFYNLSINKAQDAYMRFSLIRNKVYR